MSKVVQLEVTPLSVRIPVNSRGYVEGTFTSPLHIREFLQPLKEMFYNKITRRWEVKRTFWHFDKERFVMFLPRYFESTVITEIIRHGGDVTVKTVPTYVGADIVAPMPGFKPKHKPQADAIAFVTDESVGPVRAVTLDPGLGKTVVSFRYTSLTGKRVLIHSSINMKDWIERIHQWVKIPKEKTVFISGSKALDDLIAHIDEIDPVFILMPTQTLRPYMQLTTRELGNRPPIEDLCQHLGVHARIIDEYHKHLETHIKLDMRMNTPVTIPLTATLESSSDTVNAILDQHLPEKIRFSGEIPNHVVIYDVGFTLGLDIKEFHYKRMGMYSHSKLEEWLLAGGKHFHEKILERVYLPLIRQHYVVPRQKGQKAVILVMNVDYGEYIAQKVRMMFKLLKVTTFFKGEGDDFPDADSDIIVTTLKSGGTGTDIPGLITVLNTVAVKSSPENKQNIGRLRTIKGIHPRYIFTTWKDVKPQVEYRPERCAIYATKAFKFFTEEIRAR